MFVWFLNVCVNYKVISLTRPKTERLTILRAATHETELLDYDFCLSRRERERERESEREREKERERERERKREKEKERKMRKTER